MIALGPFQAHYQKTGVPVGMKIMVVGYVPETDKFMAAHADGTIGMFDRLDVTMDWRYDPELDTWISPNDQVDLTREVAFATGALASIAAYNHTPECPNKDDFSVWDCNCQTTKPDAIARWALERLEEMHDATGLEGPTSEAPDPALVGAMAEGTGAEA